MKKIIALLLTILTFVCCMSCLTACNNDDNTIVIGVTDYNPLDYRNEKDEWIGFDAELATKVFSELGYNVEFKEIVWDTKIVTLNSQEIDCIWNGMTITDELQNNLLLSSPYLTNKQCGLVKVENAQQYITQADLVGKEIAVEGGSAGYNLISNISCTANQCDGLNAAAMEVAAGTSDIAIVDYLFAGNITKEGSDYYNKLKIVELGFEKEQFAIGFRKADTELCNKVNNKLKELKDNGYTLELAEKYNIADALI